MTNWLAAYTDQTNIETVIKYPTRYYWELVNQCTNKRNFLLGEKLKLKLEISEKQEMIDRIRKRIAENKAKNG